MTDILHQLFVSVCSRCRLTPPRLIEKTPLGHCPCPLSGTRNAVMEDKLHKCPALRPHIIISIDTKIISSYNFYFLNLATNCSFLFAFKCSSMSSINWLSTYWTLMILLVYPWFNAILVKVMLRITFQLNQCICLQIWFQTYNTFIVILSDKCCIRILNDLHILFEFTLLSSMSNCTNYFFCTFIYNLKCETKKGS